MIICKGQINVKKDTFTGSTSCNRLRYVAVGVNEGIGQGSNL